MKNVFPVVAFFWSLLLLAVVSTEKCLDPFTVDPIAFYAQVKVTKTFPPTNDFMVSAKNVRYVCECKNSKLEKVPSKTLNENIARKYLLGDRIRFIWSDNHTRDVEKSRNLTLLKNIRGKVYPNRTCSGVYEGSANVSVVEFKKFTYSSTFDNQSKEVNFISEANIYNLRDDPSIQYVLLSHEGNALALQLEERHNDGVKQMRAHSNFVITFDDDKKISDNLSKYFLKNYGTHPDKALVSMKEHCDSLIFREDLRKNCRGCEKIGEYTAVVFVAIAFFSLCAASSCLVVYWLARRIRRMTSYVKRLEGSRGIRTPSVPTKTSECPYEYIVPPEIRENDYDKVIALPEAKSDNSYYYLTPVNCVQAKENKYSNI